MPRLLERYYSLQALAWNFELPESTIRDCARRGEFGPPETFLQVGRILRIPASGALLFQEKHAWRYDERKAEENQVKGRTLGEARRAAMAIKQETLSHDETGAQD